ncbi:hypothetical protein ACF0H5_007025 [Mactra antiquata]
MGHPTVHENMSKRKSGQKTLSEIIETFNRIKQERLNHHFDSGFTSIQNGGKSREFMDTTENRREIYKITPFRNVDDILRRRRVSLPSLFHPFSPSSVSSVTEDSTNKRQHFQVQAKRRHSVSHVSVEYSKHDLEELSKLHEQKLEQMNEEYQKKVEAEKVNEKDDVDMTDGDSELPKWINGSDLHAFYNGWQQEHSSGRKISHGYRTMKYVNNNEQRSPRSRFNSF